MTYRLHRYYGNRHLPFIACSSYRRQPWLGTRSRRHQFLKVLEEVRQRYGFVVVSYVVMPEHFHLLMSEPDQGTLSIVMQVLKQRFAHQVLERRRQRRSAAQFELWAEKEEHVWQRRWK